MSTLHLFVSEDVTTNDIGYTDENNGYNRLPFRHQTVRYQAAGFPELRLDYETLVS